MNSEVSNDLRRSQESGNMRVSPRFGEVASNALRYWEPRRILYNLVLTGVVGAHFFAARPASRSFLAWNTFFLLVFLAVLANVCYCAAYAVDIFVQYSGLRETWARWRWVVLLVGIIFGAVIAHFFSTGILSEPGAD